MEETVVSLETAKLAYEKGFRDTIRKFKGKSYYNSNGELNGDCLLELKEFIENKKNNTDNSEYKSISAPTQSLLQKWLRDTYNVHISIIMADTLTSMYVYHISSTGNGIRPDSEFYNTYEEALEFGLLEALNLI